MNEMNSLTASWTQCLASFAIFAFSGKARFMILETFAIGRREKVVGSSPSTGLVFCTVGIIMPAVVFILKILGLRERI
jgi:hypothetical protein